MRFKKFYVGVGLFCLAIASVWAAPSDVSAQNSYWGFGFLGGNFEQTNRSALYTITSSSNDVLADGVAKRVKPTHHWGYGLDGYYQFSNGLRFTLTAVSFDNKDESSAVAPSGGGLALPLPADWSESYANNASADNKFSTHNVNLLLSKKLLSDRIVSFVPELGIGYFYLHNQLNASYTGGDISSGQTARMSDSSVFKGFGPEIGFGLNLRLYRQLSLVSHVNWLLALGKLKSNYHANGDSSSEISNVSNSDPDVILQNLSLNLGVLYSYNLNASSRFNLVLGYLVNRQFGSVEAYSFPDDVNEAFYDSDFDSTGWHGPYLSVSMDF